MTETIKGGAYKGTDGTWHDANGKPLPAHVIQQLEEQERQQEAVEAPPEPEAPAMPVVAHYVGQTETAAPATVVAEPVVAKPKRKRKPKGGD